MGMYLNPGKDSYQMAFDSDIFVDKSEMIRYLNSLVNTQQRFVSVSRPRRFGKSMAAHMLCAYYGQTEGSRELFEQCLISQTEPVLKGRKKLTWDAYLGQFNVVYLVMTDFFNSDRNVDAGLKLIKERILRELSRAYPAVEYDPDDLFYSMDCFYRGTGTQFVIVIDEWDAVFREYKENTAGHTKYLDFLRDWMKGRDYIALAYMTGILPIKKYGRHSALNMFDEYSMIQPMRMAEYTGFTEKEVQNLCDEYEMEYDLIAQWYNGYRITDYIPVGERKKFRQGDYTGHQIAIYSPLSVVNAMRNGIVDNYWNKTENYEALAEYIKLDFDGLKDVVALLMDGAHVRVNLRGYQNDMTSFRSRDDILALLIHLGYLAYEGNEGEGRIDSEQGEVFIPNREILEEFKTSTESAEWEGVFEQFRTSQELLRATWAGDSDQVAELLEKAHNQAGNRTYHHESALSYSIQLAYYAAQKYYTTILELDTGKGYADVAYLPSPRYPDKPALLIELKYNQEANTAISQIKRQKYPDRLVHYRGNLLLVGINYNRDVPNTDPEFKHHTCIIERA